MWKILGRLNTFTFKQGMGNIIINPKTLKKKFKMYL